MAVQELICSLFDLGPSCQSMGLDQLMIEYLLVPSVILIIFLYFAVGFILRGFSLPIKGLLAIVMYIVVVYSGLYAVFAPFAYSYLSLMIILLMAGFFISRIVEWNWVKGGAGSVGKIYKELKKRRISEAPNEEDLWEVVELYNATQDLRDRYEHELGLTPDTNREDRRRLDGLVREKENELSNLKLQISKICRRMGGVDNISNNELKNKVRAIL